MRPKSLVLVATTSAAVALAAWLLTTGRGEEDGDLESGRRNGDAQARSESSAGSSAERRQAKGPSAAQNTVQRLQAEFEAGRFDRLNQLASEFELAELDEIWAWLAGLEGDLAAQGTSPGLVRGLRIQVLARASSLGGTERALTLVKETFGPGTNRDSLIPVIFQTSSLSSESLLEIASQLDPDERTSAWQGIGRRIARARAPLDWDELKQLVSLPGGLDALRFGLADYPAHAQPHHPGQRLERLQEAMEAAKMLISQGAAPPGFLNEIVGRIGSQLPFETWNYLESVSSPLLDDPEVAAQILRGMAISDPLRAMSVIASRQDLPGNLLEQSMAAALQKDAQTATAWYEENASTLPPRSLDQLRSAFAQAGARHEEIGTAWDWVHRIQDPQTRRRVEGQVWQSELGMVREASRQDPRATIDSIVSGESQHATYWMETVMREWMERDAAEATAWYENNRSTLTPEQTEPVALAFARRSIAEGDLATASQWAEHVLTEKNQARINGLLEEAGARPEP